MQRADSRCIRVDVFWRVLRNLEFDEAEGPPRLAIDLRAMAAGATENGDAIALFETGLVASLRGLYQRIEKCRVEGLNSLLAGLIALEAAAMQGVLRLPAFEGGQIPVSLLGGEPHDAQPLSGFHHVPGQPRLNRGQLVQAQWRGG